MAGARWGSVQRRIVATSMLLQPRETLLLLSVFICGFTAFCLTSSAAASISLKDDLGRTVELKEPARRIVTLAPFLTELVYSVGAGGRVVGVSAYSDYPPEAAKLPRVSSAAGFSIES